jgi:hypothetical protein
MKRHVSLLLIAMTSMLAAQFISPATAREYQSGEASHHDNLIPPRVDRVGVRARLLHWGMPGAHVERIMGAPAELQAYDGPGGNVRVLSYPTEPIATIVSINNGQLTGVRLDLAGIDEPTLPAYSRPVWLGMNRAMVLRILGVPTDDQLHDSFGMKLEHLIFARPGQPDVSVYFMDDRVVAKKVGRAVPDDILRVVLPSPHDETGEEANEQLVRIGMTATQVRALYGAPKVLVNSTFKGQPVEYAIFETKAAKSFGRFTFIGGVLTEFAVSESSLSDIPWGG